jgi:hypothetical protein
MAKTLIAIMSGLIVVLLVVAGVVLYLQHQSQATVLSRNAIYTTASGSVVSESIHAVYNELRLKHFIDSKGVARFPDGTNSDKTCSEKGSQQGSFSQMRIAFEDFKERSIVINAYSKSARDTLIVWEYEGGDPQDISLIIQEYLARKGVVLD